MPKKKAVKRIPNLFWIEGEKWRKYHFGKEVVTINNVTCLLVRPSGTHRLSTSTGRKYIVRAGWTHIEIKADKWSA